MYKRGISAVVATVLIILITVAAVAIVWGAIIPLISNSLDFSSLQGRVEIVTSGGYTFYDAESGLASVQVRRSMDTEEMNGVMVIFHIGGDTVETKVSAPEPGGTKVYIVNLTEYGSPDSVSVSPIFVVGRGEKVGEAGVDEDLGSGGSVNEEERFVYFAGRDYRERSCLDLKNAGYDEDGVYEIDPDGFGGGEDSFEVNCDMTRDGGGWTQILKVWAPSGAADTYQETGAVGDVSDGLEHLGNGYKLSDEQIRAIIGPEKRFSILADQSGYNSVHSNGNFEYVIVRDYTGHWTFGEIMPASTTTTTFQSYNKSNGALAWTGNLRCGYGSSNFGAGLACLTLIGGDNPMGGPGCDINMGITSSPGYHFFFMGWNGGRTYLGFCNGAQLTSYDEFSHRYWVREG